MNRRTLLLVPLTIALPSCGALTPAQVIADVDALVNATTQAVHILEPVIPLPPAVLPLLDTLASLAADIDKTGVAGPGATFVATAQQILNLTIPAVAKLGSAGYVAALALSAVNVLLPAIAQAFNVPAPVISVIVPSSRASVANVLLPPMDLATARASYRKL